MKRRQFLKSSPLVVSPFFMDAFLTTLVNGFCQKALAATNGTISARNLINIMMPGAPMRYIYDHWLKTGESDGNTQFNPMTGNIYNYSGDTISGVDYRYVTHNQIQVPYLFDQSIQLSNGPTKISSLLDNMLVMRGYGTGVDGHSTNAMKQIAPLGGVPSITGLVADNSSKPFEAIQVPDRGVFSTFVSAKGKALNKLPFDNSLKTLLVGFGRPTLGVEGRSIKERNAQAFEKAKRTLASKGASLNAASKILNASLSNAEALMKTGIGNIDEYMAEALPRYRRVITDALRTTGIDGISTKPIVASSGAVMPTSPTRFNWGIQSSDVFIFGQDYDMRNALTSSYLSLLAEGLCVAEYVINENYSQCVEIFSGQIENFFVPRFENAATNYSTPIGPANLPLILDMHATGSHVNVFAYNAFYRGLTAGILELINTLKSKNTFNNTLIQLTSDFGRITRADGTGSDHGFNQMITSVISGAFSGGPYLVGNISRGGLNSSYTGTQGLGASIKDYTQKGRPTPLAPASTLAELLNVEHNPYANSAAPLVKIKNGKLEYEFGKGAIVDQD